jgi:hypothetical protein
VAAAGLRDGTAREARAPNSNPTITVNPIQKTNLREQAEPEPGGDDTHGGEAGRAELVVSSPAGQQG